MHIMCHSTPTAGAQRWLHEHHYLKDFQGVLRKVCTSMSSHRICVTLTALAEHEYVMVDQIGTLASPCRSMWQPRSWVRRQACGMQARPSLPAWSACNRTNSAQATAMIDNFMMSSAHGCRTPAISA